MRIIVGISGASGVILGLHLLRALAEHSECETYLVITEGAVKTLACETDLGLRDIVHAANHSYAIKDFGAVIASGSFKTEGMVIIPCSMKTLSGVVHGFSDNLLLRAADVCLKERRKLILVPRELPFSLTHLHNMKLATQLGCIVSPPVMTFYNRPSSITDMISHLIGKILMIFNLEHRNFAPWEGRKE
jgi:4-hydroxy-3-polyprenylbenzoate decarboxylase